MNRLYSLTLVSPRLRLLSAALHSLMLSGLLFSLVGCGSDDGEPSTSSTAPASGPLVVVSYGGGAYQQSHKTCFLEPFSEAHSVRTESVVWGAEYGRLQEMVRSGRVVWDVVEVTAAQFSRGQDDGLFAELASKLSPDAFSAIAGGPDVSSFGVPNVFWSTVLAYRHDFFPTAPTTWKDFWDLSSFPGPRALYNDPRGNLEFALLADGVAREALYPLDVDRAFTKLDQIKPAIKVWWSDGTEPVRLLLTDQVALTSAWSGRIFASAQARSELGYTWQGAAHELDYWVVPRGGKQTPLASDFIRFASTPDAMACQAEITAYGPANAHALGEVKAAVLPHLPTAPDNWAVSFVIDSDWWSQNEEEMTTRWLTWKNQ